MAADLGAKRPRYVNPWSQNTVDSLAVVSPRPSGVLTAYRPEDHAITTASPTQYGLGKPVTDTYVATVVAAAEQEVVSTIKVLCKLASAAGYSTSEVTMTIITAPQAVGGPGLPGTEMAHVPGTTKTVTCPFRNFVTNLPVGLLLERARYERSYIDRVFTEQSKTLTLQLRKALLQDIFGGYFNPDFCNVIPVPGVMQSRQAANFLSSLIDSVKLQMGPAVTSVDIIVPSILRHQGKGVLDFERPTTAGTLSGLVAYRANRDGRTYTTVEYDQSNLDSQYLCTTEGAVICPPQSFMDGVDTVLKPSPTSSAIVDLPSLYKDGLSENKRRAWQKAYSATAVPRDAAASVAANLANVAAWPTDLSITEAKFDEAVRELLAAGFFPGRIILLSEHRTKSYPVIIVLNEDFLTIAMKPIRRAAPVDELVEKIVMQVCADYAVLPGDLPQNRFTLMHGVVGSNATKDGTEGPAKIFYKMAYIPKRAGATPTQAFGDNISKLVDEVVTDNEYQPGDYVAIACLNGSTETYHSVTQSVVFTDQCDVSSPDAANMYEIASKIFSDAVNANMTHHAQIKQQSSKLLHSTLHQTMPVTRGSMAVYPKDGSIGYISRNLTAMVERQDKVEIAF